MTKRTRRKVDAALKAKIALEAVREQTSVADLVQRYEVHSNQIYVFYRSQAGHISWALSYRCSEGCANESRIEKLKEEIVRCNAINAETMGSEEQENIIRRSWRPLHCNEVTETPKLSEKFH